MKHCPRCGESNFPDEANFCPSCAGRLQAVADVTSAPIVEGPLDGRFVLGAQIAAGATGPVFEATDSATHTPCMVKFIAPAVLPSPAHQQQALRELAGLAQSTHPSLARILGAGQRGESVWVASERVATTTLAQWIAERGVVDSETAAAWTMALARALDDAGRRGVLHRALSPHNVLCNGNRVWLINFCVTSGQPSEFRAPETQPQRPVDQLALIYGLAVLYGFLRTGRASTEGIAADNHPSLRAVMMRAGQREPMGRYMTLAQLADEITAALATPNAVPMGAMMASASGAIPRGAVANLAPPFDPTLPVAALSAQQQPVVARAQSAPMLNQGQARAQSAPVAAAMHSAGQAAVTPPGKRGDKGKFRETLWFKKGELDAEAAQQPPRNDSRGMPILDKADELPIEDRYRDDGTLNESDRRNYSLQTGATQAMPAMRQASHGPQGTGAVSTQDLIGEMRSGRGKIILLIVIGLALVAGLIVAFTAF